ncbi:MAG: hypothetical protein QOH27_3817 [Mycobacterium sp.]|nr:hypothetical protein [Mycobacterium sp.]
MKFLGDHGEVEISVGRIDGGGIAHQRTRMIAQVADSESANDDWVQVGDRHLDVGVFVQQSARQPTAARCPLQDLRVGAIGNVLQGDLGESVIVAQHRCAGVHPAIPRTGIRPPSMHPVGWLWR